MSTTQLYPGPWPQNVNKAAKYAVRHVDGAMRVVVLYETGEGEQYVAIEEERPDLVEIVNAVKVAQSQQPGGPFYVNEYRHVIVPVAHREADGTQAHYWYAGRLDGDLRFRFHDASLTTDAVAPNGEPLSPGDLWLGPRPGIPYVLAAGGQDIYWKSPSLTDEHPPQVKPHTTRKVKLSRILRDSAAVRRACEPVARIRGHAGGRFYVNERGVMFTPLEEDGVLEYTYCGRIDRDAWFPEPKMQ